MTDKSVTSCRPSSDVFPPRDAEGAQIYDERAFLLLRQFDPRESEKLKIYSRPGGPDTGAERQ